jgi:hypothetical protein
MPGTPRCTSADGHEGTSNVGECRFPTLSLVGEERLSLKGEKMKYALLIYPGTTREAIGRLSDDEQQAVMSEYRALGQESGVYGSEQLHPADTASTVRVEGLQTIVADGPFANEDIGGIYLIDVEDIDSAFEMAARIPAARLGGTVEVRPVVQR